MIVLWYAVFDIGDPLVLHYVLCAISCATLMCCAVCATLCAWNTMMCDTAMCDACSSSCYMFDTPRTCVLEDGVCGMGTKCLV